MSRALLPLVLGALLGGAAAYLSARLGTQTESSLAASRNEVEAWFEDESGP